MTPETPKTPETPVTRETPETPETPHSWVGENAKIFIALLMSS